MEVLSEGASRAEGQSSSAPRQRRNLKDQDPFANNESSFTFLFGPLTTLLYTLITIQHPAKYTSNLRPKTRSKSCLHAGWENEGDLHHSPSRLREGNGR